MASEQPTHTDISNAPELLRLAEEVLRTQRAQVLVKEGEELVTVSPVKPARKNRSSALGKPRTQRHSLLNFIGIADDGISADAPTDVSSSKHRYLAEAYAAQSRPKDK